MKPRLSIIIPSLNTAELLRDCLRSIQSSGNRGDFETIVIDNASTDGTPAMVRGEFTDTKLVELPKIVGYGAACNAGARCATGELLLFLNSDTRVEPGTLSEIVDAFARDEEISAVCCHEIASTGETVRSCCSHHTLRSGISFLSGYRMFRREGNRYLITDWDRESNRWVDNVSGFAWAIRRNVFEKIGGFDERLFLYFEEQDVALRLTEAGHRIRFVAQARVVHHGARSSQWMSAWGRRRQWVRSFVYLRRKHGSSPSPVLDSLVLFPFLAAWWVGRALKRGRK